MDKPTIIIAGAGVTLLIFFAVFKQCDGGETTKGNAPADSSIVKKVEPGPWAEGSERTAQAASPKSAQEIADSIAQAQEADSIAQGRKAKEEEARRKAEEEAGRKAKEQYDALTFAMPATPKGVPQQLLRNDFYISSFNSQTLCPNWVCWRLTDETAYGGVSRSGYTFEEDERVAEPYRVTTFDYINSGYDRGHMCPAGDNRWSAEAMAQCFLMTNMCPQTHALNAGDWEELESQCRTWAHDYGEIYIVCGPIYTTGKHKKIGRAHRVSVPEGFFKVVIRLGSHPHGIAFVYKNRDGSHPMADYVTTIDAVERTTGYNFFPTLSSARERAIESKASLNDWKGNDWSAPAW